MLYGKYAYNKKSDRQNGFINEEISTYTTSNKRTIPSGYNQAIVRTSLSPPGYGQTNTQYYFTHLNGAKFASGIEQKSWATITGKIRSYTNSGKNVHITEAKSKYGTFS